MVKATTVLVMTIFMASCNRGWTTERATTFSDDIANIVYEKCTSCHRPNSSAPFSLVSYADVRERSETIRAVLEDGYMPPWKPVDHGLAFANSRRLTQKQHATLTEWIEAGCPEGDPAKTPPPPMFDGGWSLGKPDLIVRMNGQFVVPADGPDIYRSFVFPLDLPEDKWVKAVELRPKAKSAVHHAIFFVDPSGNARKMDGTDGKAGIEGMGFLSGIGDDGIKSNRPISLLNRRKANSNRPRVDDQSLPVNEAFAGGLGGYVPGAIPNRLPGDLAMALPKGSDVVMQTHFHPSGKQEMEQAELAIYFADQAPSQTITPIMLPPMFGFASGIRIPAGESDYRISDRLTLPVDTRAIGVGAHAHYIGREVKLTASLPGGKEIILLHIDDWDLDWQDQYLFASPVLLPAGTQLTSEIQYDNSANNPENPHVPPRMIRWGRGSTDEMGSITLMTIANQHTDQPKLAAVARHHFLATFASRETVDLVDMLLQLDDNSDGMLQMKEAPPRLKSRAFSFADTDRNQALDRKEITRLIELRNLLNR